MKYMPLKFVTTAELQTIRRDELLQLMARGEVATMVHQHEDPPYGYTLGNTLYGVPELIIFGLTAKQHNRSLHAATEYQFDHPNVPDGADFPFMKRQGRPFKVKDVPTQNAGWRVPILKSFFDDSFQLRQLVIPIHGKYPWEDGYDRSLDTLMPCLWSNAS
jgi:hypothetical protein